MTMVLAPHRGAKTRAKAAHDADAPTPRSGGAAAPAAGLNRRPPSPAELIHHRTRGHMPKAKTHSGASKRFRVTGSGKIVRQKAGKRHLLEHKAEQAHPSSRRPHRRCRQRHRPRQEDAERLIRLDGRKPCRPTNFPRTNRNTFMARVKRAVNAQKKRRTVLKASKGYRGQRSRLYRKAKEQQLHSLTYAYRDRRARKGEFRKLWISRINAAARANDITYNRLIQGLKAARRRGGPQNLSRSPSAIRPRSPRWSRWPRRPCPRMSTRRRAKPPDTPHAKSPVG